MGPDREDVHGDVLSSYGAAPEPPADFMMAPLRESRIERERDPAVPAAQNRQRVRAVGQQEIEAGEKRHEGAVELRVGRMFVRLRADLEPGLAEALEIHVLDAVSTGQIGRRPDGPAELDEP